MSATPSQPARLRPSMLGVDPADASAHMTAVDDLASLVAVQPESTLSRTVLKEPGSRIVMFAFDEGQVLTEHTAAMPVLLMVLEGRLAITADGRTEELVPGGVIHLGTRLPHAVEALEPSKLALIMLDHR
ncbi:cupin domain-containing protein [Demequina sp. NBRC 110056]|uniref:cupin domain-containing protein n=1 Tax=Demequina sp. NBRC 110056 TaxID=1570345 RepID=UPI001F459F9F|nr:cupin domain-containing protein [Demequina sp. NBRC 110056]